MRSLSLPSALTVALALAGATAAHAQSLTNTGTQLTVEAGATLVIPGGLDNQAGATLSTGGTVQVGSDFRNAGTVVPASGKVVFADGLLKWTTALEKNSDRFEGYRGPA